MARLIWCDVDGAEFCAQKFGGEAIRSSHELLNVELPQVDAVWVGSLFTHVAEHRGRQWLRHIAACVNPGGVLVATFHGRVTTKLYRSALPDMTPLIDRIEAECSVTGWGYEAYDAAKDPEWGFSVTAVDHLARIAAEVPDTRIGGITEGGWAGNHDVLTLVKAPPTTDR